MTTEDPNLTKPDSAEATLLEAEWLVGEALRLMSSISNVPAIDEWRKRAEVFLGVGKT